MDVDKDIENPEEWNNKVAIICRQTTYTEDEASTNLRMCGGNLEKVINTYIDVPENNVDENKISGSVNQEIFKQIRIVMDNASKTYRESKGLEEIEMKRQEQSRLQSNTIEKEKIE